MGPKKQKIIAIHEAGHAVIARVLGLAVPHAAMFSTDGKGGEADAMTRSASWLAREGDLAAQLRAFEDNAKVSLAGPYAQSRHQQFGVVTAHRAEWRDDIQNAISSVAKAVLLKTDPNFDITRTRTITLSQDQKEQVTLLFERIGEETNKLVAENWAAIERTAEDLLRLRIISGDEIDTIIAAMKQ